ATSSGSGTSHSATLTGLTAETTYHYRITATDSSDNAGSSADRTFTTPESPTGITIDLWYGSDQTFGAPARSQQRVNIVGSVTSPASVTSLTYSVNGGDQRELSIGPDNRRLAEPGDFNADIPYDELTTGANQVAITALGSDGSTTTETVTVTVAAPTSLSLPYSTDWSADEPLQLQAQSVDGRWQADDEIGRAHV